MHQGRMGLFWLAILGLTFLCFPAAASEYSNPCARGQLQGQWFVLAIGTNCEFFMKFLTKEIMIANLTSEKEGSFTITTTFMTDYGSMEIDLTYTKQENGIYLHKSEWGDKIIERRKTDCKTYAMTCVKDLTETDGKFCEFVSLYSRTMSLPESVQKDFLVFATKTQTDKKQIFFLTKKDVAAEST